MTEDKWIKVVKLAKKRSASSIFSSYNYSICKCTIGSTKIIKILTIYYNLVIKTCYFLKIWMRILDIIIEKESRLTIRKLYTIQLIDTGMQLLIRVFTDRNNRKIESDDHLSKFNYRLRKNYVLESAILEKRLIYDYSKL